MDVSFLKNLFLHKQILKPGRFIDILQGRSPKMFLAKHYTPQGIRLLREIYDKANLRILK
jgi:hypothetical protein